MERPGVVAGKFCSEFFTQLFEHFCADLRLHGADHSDLGIIGKIFSSCRRQKSSIDDANFGQKWWRQKRKKGQGSSRAVTDVNGLSSQSKSEKSYWQCFCQFEQKFTYLCLRQVPLSPFSHLTFLGSCYRKNGLLQNYLLATRGSTATLIMLQRNLSIREQRQKKLTSIC